MEKINTSAVCLVFVFITVLGLSFLPQNLSAKPQRGMKRLQVTTSTCDQILLYNESHALVIGVSNYAKGWPSLLGVKQDAQEVKKALEYQGFNVITVMDPDKYELQDSFTDFINKYGQNPDNRLLFYFAGHGHTVTMSYGEEIGYIVPVDAPNPNRDLPGFQSKAMAMQQIEIYAKQIQSKHALFLFDACFSGSLFAISRAVPAIISYKTAKPVRQFITSGSASETVSDRSIFRDQFVRALNGEADSDGDGYLTGTELGEFLQKTVVNYSRNTQHPQYGKIRNPNLDKGDFVFQVISPAPSPQITDEPVVSRNVLLKGNYIDLSRWEILNGNWYVKGEGIYGSGGHIILNEELADYVLELTVEHISGPKVGVCVGTRYNVVIGGVKKEYRNNTSDIQGYAFNFTFSKTYYLFKGIGGNWYRINQDWKEWQYSDQFGERVNKIKIEALGNTITIYVNGSLLTSFSDGTHVAGSPLLWVQESSQIVRFSNIKISRSVVVFPEVHEVIGKIKRGKVSKIIIRGKGLQGTKIVEIDRGAVVADPLRHSKISNQDLQLNVLQDGSEVITEIWVPRDSKGNKANLLLRIGEKNEALTISCKVDVVD